MNQKEYETTLENKINFWDYQCEIAKTKEEQVKSQSYVDAYRDCLDMLQQTKLINRPSYIIKTGKTNSMCPNCFYVFGKNRHPNYCPKCGSKLIKR